MKHCILCGRESETVETFQLTAETRNFHEKRYPGTNPDEYLSTTGICEDCKSLPTAERKELASKAIRETLNEARRDILLRQEQAYTMPEGSKGFRIDIAQTIEAVHFPPEVWDWLDLLGHIVLFGQAQAVRHDTYVADTPYKQFLVRKINRDIASLGAIYLLLRCEWIHQAAAHVRLFCESVITLRYVAKDVARRLPQFLDYAHIEAFQIMTSVLEQEQHRANPVHVQQLQALLDTLRPEYERVKPRYTSTNSKGQKRVIKSWCKVPISQQATECGSNFVRLYKIVYSQLSAYVHGSEWSLRRQLGYSRAHYDPKVVLIDIATVVRTTVVVWEEWARFCDEQPGWTLTDILPGIVAKMDEMQAKHFTTPQ
jgi:hypothetical protein